MALREVLAELDIAVRGLGSLEAADAAIDRFSTSTGPAITKAEQFRAKQAELAEMAARLGQQIRKLGKAEGDRSSQLLELRVAQDRATKESKAAGAEADKLEGKTGKQASGLEALVGKYRAVAAGIGAAIAATVGIRQVFGEVSQAIEEVIAQGDALADSSKRLGISASGLQAWQYAAERSGVSADALGRAIGVLGRNAAGKGADALKDLGIATRDASGELRSREALFTDAIGSLAAITNGTERAAAAQRLFGKSGSELLTLIDEGPEGIALLRDRFAELGGGLSDDVVANASAADDAFVDMRHAITSLRSVLVANFLPPVARAVDLLATLVGGVVETIRNSSVMEAGLGTLAAALAALTVAVGLSTGGLALLLAPVLAIVAAFGLAFLAIEDLITGLRGGESVIGSFVEWILDAVGVTMTFAGAIDQIGVQWEMAGAVALKVIADMTNGINTLLVSLGLMDADAAARDAASSRQVVDNAVRNLAKSRAVAAGADATRFIERTLQAPPAEVEARKASGARPGTRNRGGKLSVNAPTTIQINGAQDPQAVAREVERHHARRIREAADTLPLAEEE